MSLYIGVNFVVTCLGDDATRERQRTRRDDRVPHKVKRQEVRGVDACYCVECGRTGPPWSSRWTVDMDAMDFDTVSGGCECGGTVVLVDD